MSGWKRRRTRTARTAWHPTRAWQRAIIVALLVLATACANQSGSGDQRGQSGTSLPLPALKLAVLQSVGGHLAYCDPDLYPVAHGNELDRAKRRLAAIKADKAAFAAILDHEGLSATQDLTASQVVAINNDYKQMQAIDLKPAKGSGYQFDVLVPQPGSDVGTLRVSGTVSPSGRVSIGRRRVGGRLNCPICLAAGVRIATPHGEVPVQDLQAGMVVWTMDRRGRRITGTVLQAGHIRTPPGHWVVRLMLADGRTVVVSPGHPTADGRTVGELRVGERYDGSRVTGSSLIPYQGFTWDLLPSGPTESYFADGVPLGSTLSPARAARPRPLQAVRGPNRRHGPGDRTRSL